ncbi:hypothetical protein [Burkholderia cenocepacia]|uniref:hypothetical protein n=1 Tax=Burkholderia cenocepacia TaxID=95486 RepID=UPI001BA8D73B|nr:hypothetical protein [Burkholderia cenocepacia]
MEWQAASREMARKIVAAGMRCKLTEEGLRITAVAECLRAMSYLCSAPTSERELWEPAASVRLTGMVRHRLAALWPSLASDAKDIRIGVMEVLDSLAELGDMVRLEGGKWLTAPIHAVRVDDGLAVLLGGGPLGTLPRSIASTARATGRVRFVEQTTCESFMDLWEADEWICAPTEGLELWSAKLMGEATARLTDAPNDMGETHVYLRREWVRLADVAVSAKELLLCRSRAGQAFSYFVGEFIRGRLRRLSAIASYDARRLRFQLDVQANRPIKVATTTSKGLVKLRLVRRLPEKEARVLLLGWQVPSPEGEHPGAVHYVFPEEVLPIIRKSFKGLGIVLYERPGAKREDQ